MRLNDSLLGETKNSSLNFQFPALSPITVFRKSYHVTYIFLNQKQDFLEIFNCKILENGYKDQMEARTVHI